MIFRIGPGVTFHLDNGCIISSFLGKGNGSYGTMRPPSVGPATRGEWAFEASYWTRPLKLCLPDHSPSTSLVRFAYVFIRLRLGSIAID